MRESMQSAREDVRLARLRFTHAASGLAPLGYVREHPCTSVGCSFLLGFGLSFFSRRVGSIALLSLLLQATELAAHLGLLNSGKMGESCRR